MDFAGASVNRTHGCCGTNMLLVPLYYEQIYDYCVFSANVGRSISDGQISPLLHGTNRLHAIEQIIQNPDTLGVVFKCECRNRVHKLE